MKKSKLEEMQRMTRYLMRVANKQGLTDIGNIYSNALSRLLEMSPD